MFTEFTGFTELIDRVVKADFVESNPGETDSPFSLQFALDVIPSPQPDREPVKILVIGSRQSVNTIVHQLHQLGFAEFNEWSRLLPASVPGQFMRILIRYVSREKSSATH